MFFKRKSNIKLSDFKVENNTSKLTVTRTEDDVQANIELRKTMRLPPDPEMKTGTFTKTVHEENYSLVIDLLKTKVEIAFDGAELNDKPQTIANLNKLVDFIKKEDKRIRDYIAENMIDKAETWLPEESDEISTKQFAERIKLTNIHTICGEEFTLSFDDDDIFAGHTIELDITSDLKLNQEPHI